MNDNGTEENLNRDRRSTLERVQKVCDRPRQRLIKHSRGNDKERIEEVSSIFARGEEDKGQASTSGRKERDICLRGRGGETQEERMTDEVDKARLFLDLYVRLHNETRASSDLINQKIYNSFILTGTIVTILLGLFYNFLHAMQQTVSSLAFIVVVSIVSIGVVMLIFTFFQGVRAYQPWQVESFNTRGYLDDHFGDDYLNVMWTTVSTLSFMIEKNRKIVESKANRYKHMLHLMATGIFFLLMAFFALLLGLVKMF